MRAGTRQTLLSPDRNKQVEIEAQLAIDELEEAITSRGGVLTPILIKNAIVERLRRFLGPGVATPIVTVGKRRFAPGYDIDIRPSDAPLSGMVITK